ncbi:MAG TPA: hypothetical protein VFQ61_13780 [Polyangiaceae bacterium]|nr:hypothetical protein [Polyangiaceae bacterium]
MATQLASPPPAAAPAPAAPKTVPLMSKFDTTLYGFVEFDAINDSTQSLNEPAGNAAIAKPGTFAGDHHRTTFGARNSRIGLKIAVPVSDDIKASGVFEVDFLGNQPPTVSENQLFSTPGLRMRHMFVKVETPIIDALFGQTWQLFGWQGAFHPNTVEIQGVPGEVFSRAPQARLSKTIKSDSVAFEIAVAAARSPQRDSGVPDGQAGMKLSFPGWKGVRTAGSTGTAADPLTIGVSGVARRFKVPEFAAAPKGRRGKTGWGISLDALIPVIPASMEKRANALTLTGSFVTGTGIADLYSGLTGGVTFPALPNPNMVNPAPTYTSNVDAGLVTYDAQGELHTIDWRSFIVGIQYYLPPSGKVWVSANYSQMKSENATSYVDAAGAAKIYNKSYWADANLFVDATSAVRFGAEYAYFHQTYGDGVESKNKRFQFSAFLLF